MELERRKQRDETIRLEGRFAGVMMSPPVDENYWAYRVILSDKQAIVGFPKYGGFGIGFAVEEDWNSNLPYSSAWYDIWDHIKHNKGDESIDDEDCILAIKKIQKAIWEDIEL